MVMDTVCNDSEDGGDGDDDRDNDGDYYVENIQELPRKKQRMSPIIPDAETQGNVNKDTSDVDSGEAVNTSSKSRRQRLCHC